jgi:hypothetical protein
MAEKRPLCLYNGQLEELKTSDSLPGGGGGGGSAVLEKSMSQPGEIIPKAGTARWYPSTAITLTQIHAHVGGIPLGQDIFISVKKNGTLIQTLTITNQTNHSGIQVNTTSLLPTDYLTVDVNQVGFNFPGSDLMVTINYTRD